MKLLQQWVLVGTIFLMMFASGQNLSNTSWILEDLGGTGVIDNTQATLSFLETGQVAGNGSCNRFSGGVTISENTLTFSALVSTRMACAEAAMSQEARYFQALEAAERFELDGTTLLIFYSDSEQPLRFSQDSTK